MPRRRSSTRKAGAGGDASAPAVKKTKLSFPQIENIFVRFEWEDDGSKWIQFSKKLNQMIADAYNAKKKEFEFTVLNGAKMVLIFDRMVQKNKKTGFERKVRVALKNDSDDDFNVIMWLDENAKWNSYSVATILEIEDAMVNKQASITTKTTPNPYLVDFKKMIQTNPKTKFSRKIKKAQAVSDADPGDEEDEEEPSTSKNGEEDVDEEEEEVKPAKSGKGKGKLKKSGSSVGEGTSKSSVRTVVMKKGSAPVDGQCPMSSKASVYEASNIVWDCMLNQTNIANNNNKFYIVQLLKEDNKNAYCVWQRWGRVGYSGQTNLVFCGGDLDKAKTVFSKKFRDKTGNDWSTKDSFQKVPGKYDLLIMDYNADNDDDEMKTETEEEKKDPEIPDSVLDKRIQELVQLICDVKSMEEAVIEMQFDAKKAPLGKLTKAQIKAGYSALKEIEELIKKKDFGRNLNDACSDFYTRIPHEFGMKSPPLIRTPQDVKKKIELLEALENIEIAIKMLKAGNHSENPIDRHYHDLKCELVPVDKGSNNFDLIEKYLHQTHASTHNHYTMQLEALFECNREGEVEQFKDFGNRMLLWHGSRLTNWAGILGQGLRIAPPEAPVTGYMFGKGVYFADMSSKSANYCFATKSKSKGILLLCDVSLGTTVDKLAADYNAASLPKNKHSVKGLGSVAPNSKTHVKLSDGVLVPVGKGVNTGVTNKTGYTLNYNEFIVYDTRQIRMKYALLINFKFK